jgi:hypothetical protein
LKVVQKEEDRLRAKDAALLKAKREAEDDRLSAEVAARAEVIVDVSPVSLDSNRPAGLTEAEAAHAKELFAATVKAMPGKKDPQAMGLAPFKKTFLTLCKEANVDRVASQEQPVSLPKDKDLVAAFKEAEFLVLFALAQAGNVRF